MDQPWRGIVDAGVVLGLMVGLSSLLWIFITRLFGGRVVDFDPGIPELADAADTQVNSAGAESGSAP
jgi:hypothetical protein